MIVIKYGGNALPKFGQANPALKIIADYHNAGNKVVLVHGGGPQIDLELAVHSLSQEMVSGYRVTTPEIFEVVQRTLSGEVLRTLANSLISHGANAVGMCAADGETIRAEIMHPLVDGTPVDLGLVGDVTSTNPQLLKMLLAGGFLPIVSPVAVRADGLGLNLNADLAAGAIAGVLQADQVIFMTDVAGIYREYPDPNSLISECGIAELRDLAPSMRDGMVPKVKALIAAIEAGAKSARVIDGRDEENLRAALLSVGSGIGTLVNA